MTEAADPGSVDAGYFRQCYDASPDPWGLAERWYEARKYAISLALLPRERYDSAFEPGCSIGVLTARLAPRCASLLACDAIPEAVAAARRRTAEISGVRVARRAIPGDWPDGEFDLIVFSEILYYFGDEDLSRVLRHAVRALKPDGHLLAVHWRHPAPDHARSGDDAHQVLRGYGTGPLDGHGAVIGQGAPGGQGAADGQGGQGALARLAGYRDADFIAEVFTHAGGDLRSVAQADGIV